MVDQERRATPRLQTIRPVKLQCGRACVRWLAGWSRDVSAEGAMIELPGEPACRPGDWVRVGLAVTSHQALLHSREMVDAVVVRCLHLDGRQHIALRFVERQCFAQAG